MPRSLFVSTAIPYVNAPPHLGFALEVVLADVVARHARARGERVHFVSGTDDNSLSNVRAAELAGVTTRELVEANAARFRALEHLLDVSFDDFVRTSASEGHVAAVHALWAACEPDLERRAYRGLYCVGCEQFVDGLCPEHRAAPELVEEENWFFKLSRYEARIREAFASGRLRIEPRERAREIERFLEGGLRDVSVSRSRTRARGWGIPVPGDPDQVIWVWFDALANYLATPRAWNEADRRVHVIGKGIVRFHACLWPALLFAARLELPTTLWVHGYVTVGGEKIGKSRGNAVAPEAVTSRFGIDTLRYFLLRHVGAGKDADIDDEHLRAVHDAELADDLGNLVARTITLLRSRPSVPAGDAPRPLADRARALGGAVDAAIERFAPDDALRAIWGVVAAANKRLADTAPWKLARDPATAPAARAVLDEVELALGCIAHALAPLLPSTSREIADALADPTRPAPILFPKTCARESSPRRSGRVV